MFDRQEKSIKPTNGSCDKGTEDYAQDLTALLANYVKALVKETCLQITVSLTPTLSILERQLSQMASKGQDLAQLISASLVDVKGQLAQIASNQQQIIYYLQAVERQQTVLIQQNKLAENASHENRLLGDQHYQEHIIEPMARCLFSVFDIVENAKRSWHGIDNVTVLSAHEVIDAIAAGLSQFLSIYQVELIEHSPADRFDPQVMRPVKFLPTEKQKLHGCVERCLQVGFRFKQARLLRPESVALYKYQEPKINEPEKVERSYQL